MKSTVLTTILIFLSGSCLVAQPVPPDSLYFGQTPPGSIPAMFAPGIVSLPNRNEAVITFSPDGASVFFYVQQAIPYTLFSVYSNNHWSAPDTIPFSNGRTTGEPFFAYNGSRVYMFATNALNQEGIVDLTYSEKQGNGWSDPVSMGNPPNSEDYQYHPCITGDTSVYFSSGAGKICRCQYYNGAYQPRVILPRPVNYIGSMTWGDPYVASDESYMILKSIRTEGYGQNDLYISYRKSDSTWTNPKNLGNIINTPGDETAGDITPDGLYMTYGSGGDLYWVSTGFIDSLRYTNFYPYLKNPLPDQTATIGVLFDYMIPDSTFFDDDGNNTLTFHAVIANGDPLPGWLAFDTITGTFTGTPETVQTLIIRVSAIDTAGASAFTNFKITVTPPVSTDRQNGKQQGVIVFPNPSSGILNVSTDPNQGKTVIAELRNLLGEIVLQTAFTDDTTLDLAGMPCGLYILRLQVDEEVFIRKVWRK